MADKEVKQFRHHPDGWIYANDLIIPLEDFKKLEPKYELEEGYIGREYIQGEFHRIYDNRDEKFLDKEWKEGDKYIEKYPKYKEYMENKIKEEDEKLRKEAIEQMEKVKLNEKESE